MPNPKENYALNVSAIRNGLAIVLNP